MGVCLCVCVCVCVGGGGGGGATAACYFMTGLGNLLAYGGNHH